jgi:hypothetical protein
MGFVEELKFSYVLRGGYGVWVLLLMKIDEAGKRLLYTLKIDGGAVFWGILAVLAIAELWALVLIEISADFTLKQLNQGIDTLITLMLSGAADE